MVGKSGVFTKGNLMGGYVSETLGKAAQDGGQPVVSAGPVFLCGRRGRQAVWAGTQVKWRN